MQIDETALDLLKRLKYSSVRLRASAFEQQFPLASFLEVDAEHAQVLTPVRAPHTHSRL
jgi:hypothetical protein